MQNPLSYVLGESYYLFISSMTYVSIVVSFGFIIHVEDFKSKYYL